MTVVKLETSRTLDSFFRYRTDIDSVFPLLLLLERRQVLYVMSNEPERGNSEFLSQFHFAKTDTSLKFLYFVYTLTLSYGGELVLLEIFWNLWLFLLFGLLFCFSIQ